MTTTRLDIDMIRSACGDIGTQLTDLDLQHLELLLLPPRIAARVVLLDDDPDHPVEGGCIVWTGAVSGGHPGARYGRIHYQGGIKYVHRVACEDIYGPLPFGLLARHRCDRPLCVRPSHLEPGTRKQNAADRARRGPSPYTWKAA